VTAKRPCRIEKRCYTHIHDGSGAGEAWSATERGRRRRGAVGSRLRRIPAGMCVPVSRAGADHHPHRGCRLRDSHHAELCASSVTTSSSTRWPVRSSAVSCAATPPALHRGRRCWRRTRRDRHPGTCRYSSRKAVPTPSSCRPPPRPMSPPRAAPARELHCGSAKLTRAAPSPTPPCPTSSPSSARVWLALHRRRRAEEWPSRAR